MAACEERDEGTPTLRDATQRNERMKYDHEANARSTTGRTLVENLQRRRINLNRRTETGEQKNSTTNTNNTGR
jgi:hypothetical protein